MSYIDGINKCTAVLQIMASSPVFDYRISKAFSELGTIRFADVSFDYYQQINKWKEEYLSVTKQAVIIIDKEMKLMELGVSLVSLCVAIIEYNASHPQG